MVAFGAPAGIVLAESTVECVLANPFDLARADRQASPQTVAITHPATVFPQIQQQRPQRPSRLTGRIVSPHRFNLRQKMLEQVRPGSIAKQARPLTLGPASGFLALTVQHPARRV